MAYFDKETYARKKEYAYKISKEGTEQIALWIFCKTNKLDFDKYENWYDDFLENSTEEDFEKFNDKFSDSMEDLLIELEPIQELSHARHDMHSSRNGDMDCFDKLGTEFSDGCLIDKVNYLVKEFELGLPKLDLMPVPVVSLDDDYEEIADYFDVDKEDVEDDYDTYYDRIIGIWQEARNKGSEAIRKWFSIVNKKFDTNFPELVDQ